MDFVRGFADVRGTWKGEATASPFDAHGEVGTPPTRRSQHLEQFSFKSLQLSCENRIRTKAFCMGVLAFQKKTL
jgi:hypothetical protein